MLPPIPPDLLPRARQIILPLVGSEDEREALLTEAFYLYDPLLYGIERDGTPKVFTIRCIKKLLDHGCLPEGEHALARLLETARYDCGVDKHPEIDDLTATVNALCGESDSPEVPTATSATVPPVTSPPLTLATPIEERTPTVFISYSHTDDAFAQRLITDLNAAGHACWIDTVKIKGGDEWVRSITEGINNSYAFVSIVSPDANESTWVRREFLWAEYKKKRIFPVTARPCELVIYLMERQVLDLHSDYEAGLSDLLLTLPAPELVASDDSEETSAREILVSRPIVNRRRLELDYLERLRAEVLFDLEKYTPLGGESHFIVQMQRGNALELAHMRPEFEHLMGSEGQAQAETRRFENAVEEILQIKRAILLGEPGGGKTTTLLSLAGELAQIAQEDARAALPLFVRLGRWTDPDQSLYGFLAEEMGVLGAHLETLLSENRIVPLLDGMNEIPVSQRKARYEQIKAFILQNPDWVAVASCREQDYTVDLQLDRITITPLDPVRVREFVRRYLGDDEGEKLFWKIAGADAQRFEQRFIERFADQLDDWQRVFWLAATLPEGVEWDREFINTFYYGWQEWRAIRDAPGSLMQLAHNPYMLSMLTQVYVARGDLPPNRGELFAKFVDTLIVREGIPVNTSISLIKGLENIAYLMQFHRNLYDSEVNALTALPERQARQFLNETSLYLAGSASLLNIGEQVRFTHQLLQEYFVACALDSRIFGDVSQNMDSPLDPKEIWPPESWWERTNWEESVILLVGLYSDDCTKVVEWVNAANPEVAALCVTRSGAKLPDATRDRLRDEWIPRLTALTPSPSPFSGVGNRT